jgi:hypothetical protein
LRFYPARHYVIIDDKLHVLAKAKEIWGTRVTAALLRQGHYANDRSIIASYPRADIQIRKIGDLIDYDISAFLE